MSEIFHKVKILILTKVGDTAPWLNVRYSAGSAPRTAGDFSPRVGF